MHHQHLLVLVRDEPFKNQHARLATDLQVDRALILTPTRTVTEAELQWAFPAVPHHEQSETETMRALEQAHQIQMALPLLVEALQYSRLRAAKRKSINN